MKIKLKLPLYFIGSALFGWTIYALCFWCSSYYLQDSTSTSPVFFALFKNDPSMEGLLRLVEKNSDKNELVGQGMVDKRWNDLLNQQNKGFSFRMLKRMGIMKANQTAEDVSDELDGAIRHIFSADINPLTQLAEKPGVELYTDFLEFLGGKYQTVYQEEEMSLTQVVAYLMAARPESNTTWNNNRKDTLMTRQEILLQIEEKGGYFAFFRPSMFRSGTSPTIRNIFHSSLEHYNVNRMLNGQSIDHRIQIEEFLRLILVEIHNERSVSYHRSWVLIFDGPMQLIMFIAFFMAVSLELVKVKKISKSFNIKLSRINDWIEWIKDSLPVFGFIGTILGLMGALSKAYLIPIAVGNTNTSIAISEITSALGLAFTTTLMAFIFNIALGIIDTSFSKTNNHENKKEESEESERKG